MQILQIAWNNLLDKVVEKLNAKQGELVMS